MSAVDFIEHAEPETWSLTEAADKLGISRSAAYELARRGDFPVPVRRVGRSLKVSRVLLDQFIHGEAS